MKLLNLKSVRNEQFKLDTLKLKKILNIILGYGK